MRFAVLFAIMIISAVALANARGIWMHPSRYLPQKKGGMIEATAGMEERRGDNRLPEQMPQRPLTPKNILLPGNYDW